MTARRLIQSLLLLAMCALVATSLGALYLVAAALAAGVAISTGVVVVWAILLAVVWPVLVLAAALHFFRASRCSSAAGLGRLGRRSSRPEGPCSDR